MSISAAARKAAAAEAETPSTPLIAVEDLRALLSQYDFRSVTPRQLGQLGAELFQRGEISIEAAADFYTALDTAAGFDLDTPIDAVAHFDMMLKAARRASNEDTTMSYALVDRKRATEALDGAMSVARGERLRILG